MNKILDELQKIKVLNKTDIINIKSYIEKKYPNNTSMENAKILSETVSTIVYNNLNKFPEEIKPNVKREVLKKILIDKVDIVTYKDIFEVLNKDNKIMLKYENQILNWIKINLNDEGLNQDLKSFFYEFHKKDKIYENIDEKTKINIKEIDIKEYEKYQYANNEIKENHIILKRKNDLKKIISLTLILISLFAFNFYFKDEKVEFVNENVVLRSNSRTSINKKYLNNNIPNSMKYKDINEDKLKKFLNKKNSVLVTEPYFSTIMCTAKEYNINPILLFSITGQEQNFVPKTEKNFKKIANNPFNVYHSWIEYNTNISDSSAIAARTVINLSKDRPKNEDTFKWIGRKYAEDKNWANGVKSIFNEINKYVNK